MAFRHTRRSFLVLAALLWAMAARLSAAPPASAPSDDFFTVVVLPDTQHYSDQFPDTYAKQTAWVRDHVKDEHIAFVSSVGDIVEHRDEKPAEWDVADKAFSTLDGVVPWGIAMGNHDFDLKPARGATLFLKHFGPERFKKYGWYGGAPENGMSSFQTIEAAGVKLMFIHMETAAPTPALDWASKVLADHPGVQTIIVTHIYLTSASRNKTRPSYLGPESHSGEEMFKALVQPNEQVFMVLCGHEDPGAKQFRQASTRPAGGPVQEIMSDFQNHKDGGNGYLRLMRFVPAKKQIEVRTYSPTVDEYLTDQSNQFVLPWEP